MISTNDELEIDESNSFANDKFGREEIANNLTNVVRSFAGKFVMCINSEFGTGKTTFIKMRQKKLLNCGEFEVFHFNAWENDDAVDPFLSIIAAIDQQIPDGAKEKQGYKVVLDIGKRILFGSIGFAAKTLTNGLLDLSKCTEDQIGDYFDKAGNIVGEEMYVRHKETVNLKQEFKTSLNSYYESTNKKILIFIDELDRCRPTYAVTLLERIKHLFDVEGYVFVLSLDINQLKESVGTVYGNGMDKNGYLRRFFDLEFNLPAPDRVLYVSYLISKWELNIANTDVFWTYIQSYVLCFKLSLRDINKLFYLIRILFLSNQSRFRSIFADTTLTRSYGKSIILALVVFLKFWDRDLFDQLKMGLLSQSDLSVFFGITNPYAKNSDRRKKFHDELYAGILRTFLRLLTDTNGSTTALNPEDYCFLYERSIIVDLRSNFVEDNEVFLLKILDRLDAFIDNS